MNKPDGKPWTVREQIIEDPVTELSFQFEVANDGTFRLRVYGNSLPLGNREFIFDANGEMCGTSTVMSGLCKPAWLGLVGDEGRG